MCRVDFAGAGFLQSVWDCPVVAALGSGCFQKFVLVFPCLAAPSVSARSLPAVCVGEPCAAWYCLPAWPMSQPLSLPEFLPCLAQPHLSVPIWQLSLWTLAGLWVAGANILCTSQCRFCLALEEQSSHEMIHGIKGC